MNRSHVVFAADREQGTATVPGTPQATPSELHQLQETLRQSQERQRVLEESEALYQSLVDNLPVRVFRKDPQGRFIFCNRAFCLSLKQPREGVIGKTDRDFYPNELAHKYTYDDRRVMETREVL